MYRSIFPMTVLLFWAALTTAQTIYLKVDANCMDRLEYNSGNSDKPYVSYSVQLGDKKFAGLDVGLESEKWVNDLSGKLTLCNSLKIDHAFIEKVNDGGIKLFMVRESSTSYHVAAVEKASLLKTEGNTMSFYGDDAAYAVNLGNPVSGVNLAMPNSKMEVYLDGIISYQCLRGYIIQKKENSRSNAFKEYVVVPEIGIAERATVGKSSFVDGKLRDQEYKLQMVDGILFRSILSETCDKMQSSYYDGTTAANNNKPTNQGGMTPKNGQQTTPKNYGKDDPCAPSQVAGIHTVQKGETLYSLSKKYQVTVGQLQEWNNLTNSNVISLCQQLWVKMPSNNTTPTEPANNDTAGNSNADAGGTSTAGTGFWTKSAAEHQVRSGETVASLAKMYGYTEDRFRKMNGLSATETVRPGQRLRTNDCNCPSLETSTKDTALPYEEASDKIEAKETANKAIDNKDVYYRPITVHLVKATDTWYSIAKQYNTTVERIWELNGMTKDDKLSTDQRIYVQ